MVVLNTCKNEEEMVKNEGTRTGDDFFMFRLDVKDDVNVNSKASFKRFI